MMFYPHRGNLGVMELLKEQGYEPMIGPNVPARDTDDEASDVAASE